MKEILLTQGFVALVDDEDYERVSRLKWVAAKDNWNVYGIHRISGSRRYLLLHQYVLGVAVQVDHRNHNGLDCQKSNLRVCTTSQNQQNQRKQRRPTSSRFKGVSWHKRDKRWLAYITLERKRHRLGRFTDELSAARAYNTAAQTLFGEFACLNNL